VGADRFGLGGRRLAYPDGWGYFEVDRGVLISWRPALGIKVGVPSFVDDLAGPAAVGAARLAVAGKNEVPLGW